MPTFKDKSGLLKRLDSLPQFGQGWECKTLTIEGDARAPDGERASEDVEIWCRNGVEVVEELIGNPTFRKHLQYAPEVLFTDESKDEEVVNEMCTGKWWRRTQVGFSFTYSHPGFLHSHVTY